MSNERYNQIIDEAYENYVKQNDDTVGRCDLWTLKKEEFINNCKIDSEFSEKWGLKIEERELSHKERVTIACKQENGIIPIVPMYGDWDPTKEKMNQFLNEDNIPTKLITLTYNNETIESYE